MKGVLILAVVFGFLAVLPAIPWLVGKRLGSRAGIYAGLATTALLACLFFAYDRWVVWPASGTPEYWGAVTGYAMVVLLFLLSLLLVILSNIGLVLVRWRRMTAAHVMLCTGIFASFSAIAVFLSL